MPPEDEQRNRNTCRICNQSFAAQNRIVCAGTCEGCYHPDCMNASTPPDIWYCLQCSITRGKRVRVLRHIPKGARIQTAQALVQAIEGCVSKPRSTAPWRQLLQFPAVALRVVKLYTFQRANSICCQILNRRHIPEPFLGL